MDRDLMGREIGRRLPGGVQARWERDPFGRPIGRKFGKHDVRLCPSVCVGSE